MARPVARAQPLPGARNDAADDRRRQCSEKMPAITSRIPRVPTADRRSSKRTSAAIGTSATPVPLAMG
jgi:hypothetical protein